MRDGQVTQVRTLGSLNRQLGRPQIEPRWTTSWQNPAPGTPQQPQNILRATLQNGPGVVDRSLALGVMSRLADNGNNTVVPADQLAPPAGNGPTEYSGGGGESDGYWRTFNQVINYVVRPASSAASAYHGYARNESVGWAIWWAVMGGLFPVVTPAIGYAQGWGEPKQDR